MLAIIAALSLMQAGEDMITRDELAAIADCASPGECIALIEQIARPLSEQPVLVLTARSALRHYGDAAIEALIVWAGADLGRTQLAREILRGWPNAQSDELRLIARLTSEGDRPPVLVQPVAEVAPDLDAYLDQLPHDLLARQYGYAQRERLLRSFSHDVPATGITPPPQPEDGPLYERLPFRWSPYPYEDAYLLADDWTRIARDTAEPEGRRAAALRGLRNLGPDAHVFIHRIRNIEEERLAGLAQEARLAALDPATAYTIAERCARTGEYLLTAYQPRDLQVISERGPLTRLESSFAICIADLAAFGRDALPVAFLIRPFATSIALPLQIPAKQLLGVIGDEESRTLLLEELGGDEWQTVYAAALALRNLRNLEDRAALRHTAATHWLPAVRETALGMLDRPPGPPGIISFALDPTYSNIRRGQYQNTTDLQRIWTPGLGPAAGVGAPVGYTRSSCLSATYSYRGATVNLDDAELHSPTLNAGALDIPFAGGVLVATHLGEWGGSLRWRPEGSGETAPVILDEVAGVIAADEHTLIVATGYAHWVTDEGTLYRVDWRTAEDWTVTPISTLPSTPRWLARLDEERFAVATAHGLVVFDRERVIGLGHCEPGPPADRN